MKSTITVFFFFAFFATVYCGNCFAESRDFWERLTNPRLRTQSGEIRLQIDYQIVSGKKDHPDTKRFQIYSFRFDGDKIRVDRTAPTKPRVTAMDTGDTLEFRQVTSDGKILDCWGCDDPIVCADEKRQPESPYAGWFQFAPLAIGIAPDGIESCFGMSADQILSYDYFFRGREAKMSSRNGLATLSIDDEKLAVLLEVDTTIGSGVPTKSRIESKLSGMVWETTAKYDLQYSTNEEAIFPSVIDHKLTVGGTAISSYQVNISVKNINLPIDSDLFTWAGLNLPAQKKVAVRDQDNPASFKTWTGTEFVPTIFTADVHAIPVVATPSRSWFLAINAVLLGFFALYFVYRSLKLRKN